MPVLGIYGGIMLGRAEVGSSLVLLSYNDTVVENWVLLLLGTGVGLFLYIVRAYSTRSLVPADSSVAIFVVALAAMFFLGSWGLYALAVPSLAWCVYCYLRVWRTKSGEKADSEVEAP